VAALSISGVYPFNGFFSKELVYDGALERGLAFYAAASLGSFLTAASFLKLGHAAFFGAPRAPQGEVREAPFAMLVPMLAIAGLCVLFGLGNALPIHHLVLPAVAAHVEPAGHHLSGPIPAAWGLAAVTVLVQAAAVANHAFGVRRAGSGLGAVDHLHHAPVARQLFDAAERRWFDPYVIAVRLIQAFARAAAALDRAIDFFFDGLSSGAALRLSAGLRRADAGNHARFVTWSMVGLVVMAAYLLGGF